MGFTHRDAEYSPEGHEGWVVAVLPDGTDAPRDTWEEALQAAEKHDLSWAWSLKYDGREGRPRAAGVRATCYCGWKGPKREARFDNPDTTNSFACEDWFHHTEVSMAKVLPPHVRKAIETAQDAIADLTFPQPDLLRLDEHRPLAAIHAATELRYLAETLQRNAVQAARNAGFSWEEIAAPLETTRQSAHERFSRP
ncbi:hypothetical protein ACFU8I_09365 [Streptomyces sp. NPDC057540]|uniref:hypothetical protein n=1 Tax=Streptomyces sp. NPDC057540 TaxID=3346160 RepID=UPI0036D074FB